MVGKFRLLAVTGLVLALCAGSLTAQRSELRLIEELRLGRVDGSGPDVFTNIDDLAVDGHGRIYVADVGWREVRLFDRDGRFVRSLAPEGDGPGERRYWPAAVSTRVTWDPHRAGLWSDDGLHLLVLDSLGAEYARDTREPGFLPGNREPMGKVFGVDAQGRLYEIRQGPSGRDSTGTLNEHEPPQTAWAVSPVGELWGVGIDEPRLWELSFTGDSLRTMSLAGAVGTGGRIHAVASDALGVEYILRLRLEINVEARRC